MTTSNSKSVNPVPASNFLGAAPFDDRALVEGQAVKPTKPGQSSKPVVFIAKVKDRFWSRPFGIRSLKIIERFEAQAGNDISFY
jgi:hypothetical protein